MEYIPRMQAIGSHSFENVDGPVGEEDSHSASDLQYTHGPRGRLG